VAAAQGKSCGACMMCCIVLEIDELKKPAGPACRNCAFPGCSIYPDRPQVCRDFECEWLMSRTLPQNLLIGAILMEDPDTGEYRAVCAPGRRHVWRNPRVLAHLIAMAKSGRTVVAKAGTQAWRVFPSGETGPTV
jgi:hypothetical protein